MQAQLARPALLAAFVVASCGRDSAPPSPWDDPSDLPAGVMGLLAMAGDASVRLDWQTVERARGYHVYFSTSASLWGDALSVDVLGPPFVHEGLTNGSRYYYAVKAYNDQGEGPASSRASALPMSASASPPMSVVAAAGEEAITITWLDRAGAPPATGAAMVTGYNIYYATQASGARAGTLVTGARSPYQLVGLTNGATYYIVVTALAGALESAPSAEVSAMPVARLPDAPTGLAALAGEQVVTLTWTDVAGATPPQGHAAVTGYRIYWSTTTDPLDTGSAIPLVRSPYVHEPVTNGTHYYYALTAEGAGGESGPSLEVSAVPTARLPDMPQGFAASAGVKKITLTWTDLVGQTPAAGHAAVTSYKLYGSTSTGSATSGTLISGVRSGYEHTPLTPGTRYYYVLVAVNDNGDGEASGEVWAVPSYDLPGAPVGASASPGDGQITVSWTDLAGTVPPAGQAPVTGYNVYWGTMSGAGTGGTLAGNQRSPFGHGSLTNGTRYYYVVTAVSAAGEGAASGEVSAVPVAAEPRYALGGVVSGLLGTGLVVANSNDMVSMSLDGPFTFATGVAAGASFAVAVKTPPASPAQKCVVIGGFGTMPAAPKNDLEVVCSLQVATFNLENFSPMSAAPKQQAIADIILDNGFDVVAVEEVSGDAALASFIAGHLDETWHYVLGTTGNTQRVGFLYRSSVLARVASYEITSATSGGIIVETAPQWVGLRLPYRLDLDVAESPLAFSVIAVHLKAESNCTASSCCDRRGAQMTDLATYLQAHASDNIVLLGDYNDTLSGQGICTPFAFDAMAPLEALTNFTFATLQPTYLAADFYTNIPFTSTIDHLLVAAPLFALLLNLNASSHKTHVVMHGDVSISDHQPPYIWLGLE